MTMDQTVLSALTVQSYEEKSNSSFCSDSTELRRKSRATEKRVQKKFLQIMEVVMKCKKCAASFDGYSCKGRFKSAPFRTACSNSGKVWDDFKSTYDQRQPLADLANASKVLTL